MNTRTSIITFACMLAGWQTGALHGQSFATAVFPLPPGLRAGATVVRLDQSSQPEVLRRGTRHPETLELMGEVTRDGEGRSGGKEGGVKRPHGGDWAISWELKEMFGDGGATDSSLPPQSPPGQGRQQQPELGRVIPGRRQLGGRWLGQRALGERKTGTTRPDSSEIPLQHFRNMLRGPQWFQIRYRRTVGGCRSDTGLGRP